MSKVDAQRAMREARYARLRASGPTRREEAAARGTSTESEAAPSPAPATPARATKQKAVPQPAKADGAEGTGGTGALCGYQSISGRTCTREAGHAQKSHRYG